MAAVIVLSKFNASMFFPMRETGMPIITATRVTVSIASAGWLFHQVSVLAILSLRTFLFGSDKGSSFSQLKNFLPAREDGICWANHGFVVVVPTSSEDGSKAGGAGGAGLPELRMSATWIGLAGGLEAEGPVGSGLVGSSPSC